MTAAFLNHVGATLDDIEAAGLFKRERLLAGPQGGRISVAGPNGEREAVNLCANNYLGLADHPEVIAAAQDARWTNSASAWPRCVSSAARRRCIASSNRRSQSTSARTTRSCSPPVSTPTAACSSRSLDEADAIISDSLNHASIIDGVRLSKAKRYRFANSNMNELEDRLKEADAAGARFKLIATDGVFSMDGYCRQAEGDLRPRRSLRRDGAGRRLPRDRASRRKGARHAGADRRGRSRRHRHRHLRQDARRRHGRLRRRGAADRRSVEAARAALSVLEFARAARSPPGR